jgi:hypothetical protein
MKIEYGEYMKNLQDLHGVSLMTLHRNLYQHGCLYIGTQSTEGWSDYPVIYEVCIQMKLQQQDAPFHFLLETKLTPGAYSEDNEE